MNYYPFHIGDYAAHTRHLSLMEDLAYRRLLDAYYLNDGPLKGGAREIAREIGMLDHVDAVEYVLGKFFERQDDAWRSARCDEEIAKYQRMAEGGRSGASKRWRQREDEDGAMRTDAVRQSTASKADAKSTPNEDAGHMPAGSAGHDQAMASPWGGHAPPIAPPIDPPLPTKNQEPRTNDLTTTSWLSSEPPPAAPGSDPPGQLLDPPQRLCGQPERAAEASGHGSQPAQVLRLPERRIPCPHERLLEAFHAECPTLPRVLKLNDRRRQHLSARWREVDADAKLASQDDGVELFRAIFRKVHESDFLSGRSRRWQASFDWLIESSTHFLRVCEGHYDNGRMDERRAAR